MKYILKSNRVFIQNDPIVFLISFICMLIVSIVVLFSFGLFFQFAQNKVDDVNMVGTIEISFEENVDDYVNWGQLRNVFRELNSSVCSNISCINMKAKNPYVNTEYFEQETFDFCLSLDGEIMYYDLGKNLKQSGLLKGRWFTEEEFYNGEKVAVGFGAVSDFEEVDEKQESICKSFEKENNPNIYILNGQEYQKIGDAILFPTPIYPVTSLPDKKSISSLIFVFDNESVTSYQYDNICNVLKKHFGNLVHIPDIKLSKVDETYKFQLSLLVVLLVILAASSFALQYEYIFIRNIPTYHVFSLLGLRRKKILLYFIIQCSFYNLIAYCCGAIMYFVCLLPKFGKNLSYLKESYSVGIVFDISILFLFVNLIVATLVAFRMLSGRKLI